MDKRRIRSRDLNSNVGRSCLSSRVLVRKDTCWGKYSYGRTHKQSNFSCRLISVNNGQQPQPHIKRIKGTINPESRCKRKRCDKMALALAIPLFGLNNDYFSALNGRLLNMEHETWNMVNSGRNSPNDSNGIGSIAMSAESTPIPSRSETPVSTFCKNQVKDKEEKEETGRLRIIYSGRDILNLGSNLRQPSWQLREQTLTRHEYENYLTKQPTKSHDTKTRQKCKDCGFKIPRV
ncbi:hypothetical protein HN011_006882 [Eciton burchellii]|nr:hypothetical protein HN011_006882 [Eciton burchellii]